MEKVACSLCGSKNAAPKYALPDYLLGRENVTTFVNCNNCGLIYQNPRPTLDEMKIHYPPEYESYKPDLSSENHSRMHQLVFRYGLAKRARALSRGTRVTDGF
jgi:hypothetical protein